MLRRITSSMGRLKQVTPATGDKIPLIDISSSNQSRYSTIAQILGISNAPVNVTSSTVTITAASHANRVITLNRAAGIAVTLPAASGTGNVYEFVVGTTVTSNSTTIKAASSSDAFVGSAWVGSDDAGAPAKWYGAAAASDDTVTLNGTTTGGYAGHVVRVTDIATNLFKVESFGKATGTEATPFSATV